MFMKHNSSHEALKNKPFELLAYNQDVFRRQWEKRAMEAAEADGGQFGAACQALMDEAEDAWEENQYEHPADIIMYYWRNNY